MAEGNVNIITGGGGTTIHNDLTGRDAADVHPHDKLTGLTATGAHPGSAVSAITTNFKNILFAADNDLQKAIERLDNTLSFKQLALRNIEKMFADTPDVVLTTTGATDLQTAITALTDGQILEIQTNGTYDPITLPAGKSFRIRTKYGYNPKITGTRCISIDNGAGNIVINGLTIENPNNSGGNNNYQGSAITFSGQGCIVDNIVFYNCTIKNTVAGSAVMLSYHWSVGGDNYANPPQLAELSSRIAFIGCNIFRGCLDGNEGACLSVRALKDSLFLNNYIDNYNDAGRGIQMQGCLNILCESNKIFNIGGGNAEGIKLDQIGTSPFRQSGYFYNNYIENAIEGIDADDNTSVFVIGNVCKKCTDEGISLDGGADPANAYGIVSENTCFGCGSGILFESGSIGYLSGNNCFFNTTNYNMLNGYIPDLSNAVDPRLYYHSETVPTPDGGIAVRYINKTGANSIKGYIVRPSNTVDNAIDLSEIDSADPVGFFYESGIADGQYAWIVIGGRGQIYCVNASTRRDLIRVCVAADIGAANGVGFSEAFPAPPLSTDKHFREVAHSFQTTGGPGLVWCDSSHKN